MDWGSDPDIFPITTGYKRVRRVNRALMETWFREIALVDIDTLPDEGGVLFTTWHPGGMIDPMLMMAALPGNLTFAAKHTLFKIPILGRLIRSAGAVPAAVSSSSKIITRGQLYPKYPKSAHGSTKGKQMPSGSKPSGCDTHALALRHCH